MDYQNITLSVPKDILKKAKIIAVNNNISASKLLSNQLQEIVEKQEDYDKAHKRQSYLIESGLDMQVREKPSWRRE